MKLYFDTPERLDKLQAEAESWRGTPFFPHSRAKGKGGGVDCVNICHEIYTGCGVMERCEIPPFPMDWSSHKSESVLLKFLETLPKTKGRLEKLPPTALALPGDLLAFEIGKCVHHLGVRLQRNRFIHCLKPYGVLLTPANEEEFSERLKWIFRPLENLA